MSADNITSIAIAAISLIGALITAFLVPILRKHERTQNLDELERIIGTLVHAAEMMFPQPKSGISKKAYVIEQLQKWGWVGKDFSESNIDAIIEAAVTDLRLQQKAVDFRIQ